MFDIICTPSASVNAMGCFIANAVLDSYDHDSYLLFYISTRVDACLVAFCLILIFFFSTSHSLLCALFNYVNLLHVNMMFLNLISRL